jgi:hypothetical protein
LKLGFSLNKSSPKACLVQKLVTTVAGFNLPLQLLGKVISPAFLGFVVLNVAGLFSLPLPLLEQLTGQTLDVAFH